MIPASVRPSFCLQWCPACRRGDGSTTSPSLTAWSRVDHDGCADEIRYAEGNQASEPSTTSTSTVPTSTPAVAPATVTMHRLGPLEAAPPPAAASAPEVAKDQWTVKPSECFWSIADSVLSDRLGRPATDAEIIPYWHRLIEANRHQLVQRDNPDLVLPGQVFAVPAP